MTGNGVTPMSVVRISKGKFDAARAPEVAAWLQAGEV